MAKQNKQTDFQNLPSCATEFIGRVIKKMRYRKKIRRDVPQTRDSHLFVFPILTIDSFLSFRGGVRHIFGYSFSSFARC